MSGILCLVEPWPSSPGFVAQLWYARHRDYKDVKKIQDLLKLDFMKLYQIAMKDRNTARKARKDIDKDEYALHDGSNEADETWYLDKTSGGRFHSLVWPSIASSGKILKMKKEEIEVIQLVQEGVIKYNRDMANLQRDTKVKIKQEFSPDQPLKTLNMPYSMILEEYLNEYDKNIDELLAKFKELKKLAWFGNDSLDVQCQANTADT